MVSLLQPTKSAIKYPTLDYCKLILEKVYFEPSLFQKEYYKSLRQLSEQEKKHLRDWVTARFGAKHASPAL